MVARCLSARRTSVAVVRFRASARSSISSRRIAARTVESMSWLERPACSSVTCGPAASISSGSKVMTRVGRLPPGLSPSASTLAMPSWTSGASAGSSRPSSVLITALALLISPSQKNSSCLARAGVCALAGEAMEDSASAAASARVESFMGREPVSVCGRVRCPSGGPHDTSALPSALAPARPSRLSSGSPGRAPPGRRHRRSAPARDCPRPPPAAWPLRWSTRPRRG